MQICKEKQDKKSVVVSSFLFFAQQNSANYYADSDYALD